MFDGILNSPELMQSRQFHLRLLGGGSLEIPEQLNHKVSIDSGLMFKVCVLRRNSLYAAVVEPQLVLASACISL